MHYLKNKLQGYYYYYYLFIYLMSEFRIYLENANDHNSTNINSRAEILNPFMDVHFLKNMLKMRKNLSTYFC